MRRARRWKSFFGDVLRQTLFVRLASLLILLWLLFAAALWYVDHDVAGSPIRSYGQALYWGIAAFSTAGIANPPVTAAGHLIGGLWIVVGSTLFFGAIVATVTAYFMRPLQRPARQIVETIEFNLEHLDELSIEELDLLKSTVDTLIGHMERVKHLRGEQAASAAR
jgi:voltage-gated potassium channel